MKVLLDTSVVLRALFGETGRLQEWAEIQDAFGSRLLPLEMGRVIDRVRLAGEIDDVEVEQLHREGRRLLRSIEVIGLSEEILMRAQGPMPTSLGTLDSVHLATALELSKTRVAGIVLATHDTQLARAARSLGLDVIGA